MVAYNKLRKEHVSYMVKKPKMIVSLAPSNTEILFALGLEDEVIGVTALCDYPLLVKEKIKAGKISAIEGNLEVNVEKIVSLRPDLVLAATSLQNRIAKTLKQHGLEVLLLDPGSISEVLESIIMIGKIAGRASEAEDLANSMKQRIGKIVDKTRDATYRPKIYYEEWYKPLITVSPRSYINDVIELSGGINLFRDPGNQLRNHQARTLEVSSEEIIQRNPEIIAVGWCGFKGRVNLEDIKKRTGWNSIEAVRNHKIYAVDESLFARPGPRIVEGLELLAQLAHPELFTA